MVKHLSNKLEFLGLEIMGGKIMKFFKRWIVIVSYTRAMGEFSRMGRTDLVINLKNSMIDELETLK